MNVGERVEPGHGLHVTLTSMLPFAEYSVRMMTREGERGGGRGREGEGGALLVLTHIYPLTAAQFPRQCHTEIDPVSLHWLA